jgi:molybdopterin molybdotransferase
MSPPGHDTGLVPLTEAQALVMSRCRRLPSRSVPIDQALGAVLAEPLVAGEAIPSFANTAMDGYAVRFADTLSAPVTLQVVGTQAAGAVPGVEVGPGQAVRIMTGAAMPAGTDAVVMVERTVAGDEGRTVTVQAAAGPGDHIRRPGEDVSPGQLVFAAGTRLEPGHLGMAAGLGCEALQVIPPARVGVLSTGDELIEGSGPLRPGQIRDSNRHSLLAQARLAGCEVVDLGIATDDEQAIAAAVTGAVASCDAVLTSGGVSVGDFDYVKVVLDRLSEGTMRWMQVAVRPAKPFAFGTVGGVPVFGLPGNPVSSMVSFECFARPGLRLMMGHPQPFRPHLRAVADENLARRPDGKVHLVRVIVDWGGDGRLHVRSSGGQESHLLRAMANANGLAVLPDGSGVVAGQDVEVMVLSGADGAC